MEDPNRALSFMPYCIVTAAMVAYFRTVLSDRVSDVRVSERVTSYPAMVVDHESAAGNVSSSVMPAVGTH